MKTVKVILLAFLVLGFGSPGFADDSPKTLKEILGADGAATVFTPETVSSYRLGVMNMSPMVMPTFGSGKYVAGNPGPALTPPQIKALLALLSKALPYRGYPLSNCRFNPGIALRFLQGQKTLNLLFCFSCNEWAFENQGKMVYATFGPDRKTLVGLAKALFPQDAEIQKLN